MSKAKRGLSLMLVVVMLVSLLAVMPVMTTQADAADASQVVSAWHTSMLNLTGEKASTALSVIQAMPNTSTYRSRLQMNAAGNQLRVTLTNYFGGADLKVTHMTVARPGGSGNATSIDTSTLKTVTVNGKQAFTIPRGGSVTTDWIDYSFVAGETLTFSTCLSNSKQVRDSGLTGGASWLFWSDYSTEQDSTGLFHLQKDDKDVGNYDLVPLITNVDANCTSANPYTVVVIGDSTVTNSIPSLMQANLRTNGVRNVSVVSSAIKGNELLGNGVGGDGPLEGDALLARFGLDATNLSNVKKIFVKVGVNDIIHPNCSNLSKYYDGTPSAQEIIDGYKQLISAAHAKGIEIYFFDLTPWIGYTRENTVTTNETTIAQMEAVRLEVNQWLADNCKMDENSRDENPVAGSMSFGYIPVSEAIGTARSGHANQYVLAADCTTDHIHYSAAGQKTVANLVPISIFKDVTPIEGQGHAAVKNLYTAVENVQPNESYYFASTPGSVTAVDQQTKASLLGRDPKSTKETEGARVGTNIDFKSVPIEVQRGQTGAPYIAVSPDMAATPAFANAYWSTNSVQSPEAKWNLTYNGTTWYMAFYYSLTAGIVDANEFTCGFVKNPPASALFDDGIVTFYALGSTNPWPSDPYASLLYYGTVAGDDNKYLTYCYDPDHWNGLLDNPFCDNEYKWRVVSTAGNAESDNAFNRGNGVTLLQKLDTLDTYMTVIDSDKVHYAAPAGTAVNFDYILKDELYTRSDDNPDNETVLNTADNANAGNLPFNGYTYGKDRVITITEKSDDNNVITVKGNKVTLTGEAGTATVTLKFEWTELDGTEYEMSADATVTNIKYDCDIIIDGEAVDSYTVNNYTGDATKDVSVTWTSVPVADLPEGGAWVWDSSDSSIFTVNGSGENATVSFTEKSGTANLTAAYVKDGKTYCSDTVSLTNITYGMDIQIGDDNSTPYLDSRTYIGVVQGEQVVLTAKSVGVQQLPAGGTYTWTLDAQEGATASAKGDKATVTFDAKGGMVFATATYTLKDGTEFVSSVAVFATAGVASANTVIDFGLPVQINLNSLSGSVANGISADAPRTALNTGKSTEDEFNGSKTAALTFGDAALADDGVMTYTPNKFASDKDTVFYSAKAEGGYKYSNVDIIPASNVYYEDSFVSFSDGWVNDGTEMLKYQSADDRNPYGYDEAYGDYTTFSMGSAMKATVKDGDGKTYTASFTFTGTGFEIYSVTNAESGGAVVKYTNSDGTVKKANVVNNYSQDSFYQLPCYSATGLKYDTYTVTVTVAYSRLFDSVVTAANEDNGVYTPATYKGSYSFWIDGVRVYDCANKNFNDIYAADNEANVQYISIRDQLISKAEAEKSKTINGAVFVDSSFAGEQKITSVADYKNFGPKNEVYLAKDQSIAFSIENAGTPADIQIGAKLAGANGVGVLTVNTQKITDLTSATNMYYSIKSACTGDMIVITNTGDAVISITNLKLTYANAAAPAMLMFSMDMVPDVIKTVNMAIAAPETEVPAEPTTEPTTNPGTEPGTNPTDKPTTNPTENPGSSDNGNNGGDNGDNGDDNDSGTSIIQLIQKAIKAIKTAFGNLFGGKK